MTASTYSAREEWLNCAVHVVGIVASLVALPVLATTALLRANPKPTAAEVRHACAGNLCRCGSQPHIIQAALAAAGAATTSIASTADALRHDHA